jgi:cation:H+ antiporter
MLITLGLFVAGFYILIKGAGALVSGASALAYRYGVPAIVVGLTIVAFGTSTPELVVNLLASWQGNTDIAIGNILGSNIGNILLILGITAMIYPVSAQKNTVLKEIPFSLLAALVVAFLASDMFIDGAAASVLTRIDGLILLSFFAVFMYYIVAIMQAEPDEKKEGTTDMMSSTRMTLSIILGLAALVLGGKWVVDGAVALATLFGMSESVIGLTVVAIGTSLPELATSVVAALKKESDIAIGNVVGSNIFNIFWILGVSALIAPLPFAIAMNMDIFMTIAASLLLFVAMYIGKRHVLEKWQGAVFVIIYAVYVISLIVRN